VEAFATLAGKLSARQATVLANRIVERAAKATDADSLRYLSQAFAALSGKLPFAQTSKQASTLAGRLVGLAARTEDSDSLRALSEAFTALAGKLSTEARGKEANTLAGRLVELAARRKDPSSLDNLSQAFAALPGKRKDSQVTTLVLPLARVSHHARTSNGGIGSLDRLLPQVSSQTILEALKHPGCVGTTRTVLLKHLGKRYQRSFRDVWELVDHLPVSAPNLDLDSPLRPAQAPPQPAR
jgi:hypothetical protein